MTNASPNDESQLKNLTKDQDEQLIKFASTWQHIWRKEPVDREGVAEALSRMYKTLAHTEMPPILWCESPWQLVMTKAILILQAITPGDDKFHAQLVEELNSPLWKRVWKNLDEQKARINITNPEPGKPFNFDSATGIDYASQMGTGLGTNIASAQEIMCEKMSVPVKLRLRQVFRETQPNANELRFGTDRLSLIRGQWGLLSFGGLIGDDTLTKFMADLSNDLQKRISDLCKERLYKKPNPFSMFARDQKPEEELFEALRNHANSPLDVPELRHVGFVLKYLPIEVPADVREPIVDWLTIKENVFHLECMKHLCVLVEAPIAATVNERNLLHNDAGAAMEFRDGSKLYAWGGVIVPPEAVEATQKISIEQIDKEQNAEVRRVLIQQYGLERYLEDSGARQIDADEYGILYKKSLPNDEPVVVVKVTNRTAEPDGSRKFYFLRVPPYMTSARNAVAWTFNMSPEEYQPTIQT